MKRHPHALAGILLAAVALVAVGCGVFGPTPASPGPASRPSSTPAGQAVATTPSTATAPAASAPTAPVATADPDLPAPPVSDPPALPTGTTATPIVPVTQFRTTRTATTPGQVAAILAGTSDRYDALELVAADAEGILANLGLEDPGVPARLVLAPDAATLTRDLAKHRKRLGFLRATDVTPAVRALAWGKASLFGNARVTSLAVWPLIADLPTAATGADDRPAFDPSTTWTLFAAGDIMLDRGVYETVRVKKKGVDFPFDGGTAEITGHCKDCSPLGWDTPYTKRTGNKGAMRDLIEGADLAIANFENPAPDAFKWHTKGTVFSADPGIIKGIANAGFDWVGLANNHIGDQGRKGVLQTIKNVERDGLAHAGAGKNAAAARTPSIFTFGDTKVAILAYDAIYKPYHATSTVGGSAAFTTKNVTADVKKARKAGADVVIVFPHWGIEYRYAPTQTQRSQAHAIIDAGADMIIGNHAHYAAAMEAYKGKPIWYALGNFVFDQTWSEPTMEGVTLELTFHGSDLAQARIRPHLILDKAQPNLMDPAGDGRAVLDPIWKASKGLLPW